MEEVILGLTHRTLSFNNPFVLAQHIQQTLIQQAEQAGSRALEWDISQFDKIGGKNTLRTVWASLKEEQRTKGLKRQVDLDSSTESYYEDDRKRVCRSLGLSGTCDRLGEINLDSSSDGIERLRVRSSSDTSIDISLLLDETEDHGEVDRMLEGANILLDEVAELIPDLERSSSEAVTDSDSGNSECNWGWIEQLQNVGELVVESRNGSIVPVTVGTSSVSDSEEEMLRIVSQVNNITESDLSSEREAEL